MTSADPLPLLEFAKQYARAGWPVLPLHTVVGGVCSCRLGGDCKHGGKHPRIPNGVHGASTNETQIAGWWHRWPDANVGIATGRASGVWVLDIDPRNGGDESFANLCGEASNGQLEQAMRVVSKTGGGGSHLLFAYPDGGVSSGGSSFGDGIDVKSDGGYIVAPPSLHVSGKGYEWDEHVAITDVGPAPAFIADKLAAAPPAATQAPPRPRGAPKLNERQIADVTAALAVVPADDRETWLRVGMSIHSEDPSETGFLLWDEWSRKSPKHDLADSRRVWASFDVERYDGVTLSAVFGIAKEHGYAPAATTEAKPVPVNVGNVALVTKAPPMGERLLHPPGILDDIVGYINRTAVRPQPPLAVAGAFSLAATICGRNYESASGLRSNLYVVGMGPTGCGKNHARDAIKKILHQADLGDLIGGEELASGQAILSRVSMTPSVIFQLDEFGLLMEAVQNPNSGNHVAAIMSTLMKLFSSAHVVYYGTEYADQDKRPRVSIEYPCVNIHATTTPETFYRAMRSKHVVSGYLNRLVVVGTSVLRPKRQDVSSSSRIPRSILDWIDAVRRGSGDGGNLGGINPATPFTVLKDSDAAEAFDAFDKEIDGLMERDAGTGLEPLWNRAWEHADKLALVCALAVDPHSPIVRGVHADYAIALTRWSVGSMIRAVQENVADSAFDARAKEVYRAIAGSGQRGLTERELARHGAYRRLQPRERSDVMAALKASGEVVFADLGRPARGGHQRTAFVAVRPDDLATG